MSCIPAFEKNLDFECIKEIIFDIRNGEMSAETVKRGLWVLGCGVEFFVPKTIIGDSSSVDDKSMLELCDDLEMCMQQPFGSEENPEEPSQNPLIWISLAGLVFQVIQFLRNRNR